MSETENDAGSASKDWIRRTRTQCNIQGRELAERMRVSPARISVLERDEQRGAVTLKMMQKAATALGYDFVYAFIPKTGQTSAKPKIRLDTTHMCSDREQQVSELQQQYRRSLSKTTAG